MLATMVLSVVLVAGSATLQAQDVCVVGAYADVGGTESVLTPIKNSVFSVYIVLFTEDFANAVAYSLTVPGSFGAGSDVFPQGDFPNGPFADILRTGDTVENRMGFGGCINGFGGTPILAARHDFIIFDEAAPPRVLEIGPDTREAPSSPNPFRPIYSTCQGVLKACGPRDLVMETVIPVDSESWGGVKSLFGN
jgi:hypothetical protein